jgi:rhodanese-related sulfurtransferase
MNVRDHLFDHKNNTVLKITSGLFALILSITIPLNSAIAEEKPDLAKPKIVVPEKIAGVTTVNAEEVIEKLTSEQPPILIDARIRNDREHGFIENSISLPDINTNCDTLKDVSEDKGQHLMFYCNGVQCGRSVVSIKVASSCGYHKLSWFKGGFAEWKEKGYQYETQN